MTPAPNPSNPSAIFGNCSKIRSEPHFVLEPLAKPPPLPSIMPK